MNGVDDYFPPTTTTIRSLLFQLVPTKYRAQRYNRQLQREIEENPDGALVEWRRENSSQLYYVFHGMAGGLGISLNRPARDRVAPDQSGSAQGSLPFFLPGRGERRDTGR